MISERRVPATNSRPAGKFDVTACPNAADGIGASNNLGCNKASRTSGVSFALILIEFGVRRGQIAYELKSISMLVTQDTLSHLLCPFSGLSL